MPLKFLILAKERIPQIQKPVVGQKKGLKYPKMPRMPDLPNPNILDYHFNQPMPAAKAVMNKPMNPVMTPTSPPGFKTLFKHVRKAKVDGPPMAVDFPKPANELSIDRTPEKKTIPVTKADDKADLVKWAKEELAEANIEGKTLHERHPGHPPMAWTELSFAPHKGEPVLHFMKPKKSVKGNKRNFPARPTGVGHSHATASVNRDSKVKSEKGVKKTQFSDTLRKILLASHTPTPAKQKKKVKAKSKSVLAPQVDPSNLPLHSIFENENTDDATSSNNTGDITDNEIIPPDSVTHHTQAFIKDTSKQNRQQHKDDITRPLETEDEKGVTKSDIGLNRSQLNLKEALDLFEHGTQKKSPNSVRNEIKADDSKERINGSSVKGEDPELLTLNDFPKKFKIEEFKLSELPALPPGESFQITPATLGSVSVSISKDKVEKSTDKNIEDKNESANGDNLNFNDKSSMKNDKNLIKAIDKNQQVKIDKNDKDSNATSSSDNKVVKLMDKTNSNKSVDEISNKQHMNSNNSKPVASKAKNAMNNINSGNDYEMLYTNEKLTNNENSTNLVENKTIPGLPIKNNAEAINGIGNKIVGNIEKSNQNDKKIFSISDTTMSKISNKEIQKENDLSLANQKDNIDIMKDNENQEHLNARSDKVGNKTNTSEPSKKDPDIKKSQSLKYSRKDEDTPETSSYVHWSNQFIHTISKDNHEDILNVMNPDNNHPVTLSNITLPDTEPTSKIHLSFKNPRWRPVKGIPVSRMSDDKTETFQDELPTTENNAFLDKPILRTENTSASVPAEQTSKVFTTGVANADANINQRVTESSTWKQAHDENGVRIEDKDVMLPNVQPDGFLKRNRAAKVIGKFMVNEPKTEIEGAEKKDESTDVGEALKRVGVASVALNKEKDALEVTARVQAGDNIDINMSPHFNVFHKVTSSNSGAAAELPNVVIKEYDGEKNATENKQEDAQIDDKASLLQGTSQAANKTVHGGDMDTSNSTSTVSSTTTDIVNKNETTKMKTLTGKEPHDGNDIMKMIKTTVKENAKESKDYMKNSKSNDAVMSDSPTTSKNASSGDETPSNKTSKSKESSSSDREGSALIEKQQDHQSDAASISKEIAPEQKAVNESHGNIVQYQNSDKTQQTEHQLEETSTKQVTKPLVDQNLMKQTADSPVVVIGKQLNATGDTEEAITSNGKNANLLKNSTSDSEGLDIGDMKTHTEDHNIDHSSEAHESKEVANSTSSKSDKDSQSTKPKVLDILTQSFGKIMQNTNNEFNRTNQEEAVNATLKNNKKEDNSSTAVSSDSDTSSHNKDTKTVQFSGPTQTEDVFSSQNRDESETKFNNKSEEPTSIQRSDQSDRNNTAAPTEKETKTNATSSEENKSIGSSMKNASDSAPSEPQKDKESAPSSPSPHASKGNWSTKPNEYLEKMTNLEFVLGKFHLIILKTITNEIP